MAVSARLETPPPVAATEQGLLIPATILVGLLAASAAFLGLQRPAVVIVAFVVAAVVFLCVVRVDFAILLLVATVPLEGAIQFGGSQITVSKQAGALCFGSFLLFALASRRKLLFDRSHALIMLILGLAILSTLQARDIPQGLATTLRYGSFVALYVVVSQFVGDERLHRRIVWVLSGASTVAGLLTIQNFLSGRTLQAALPYTNANDTAFVLATTLPLTFWLLRERLALRVTALVMIGVISASILLSFSRGALVGLGVAALWHLVSERRHVFLLAVGGVAALLATFALVRTNPGQVESGLQAKEQVAEYNVEARLQAWSGALELIEERPLLGVGPGNFRYHFYDVTGSPPGTHNVLVVHNAYLDVGAEVGVLAMLLFVGYVGLVLSRASVARQRDSSLPGYASALRSALIVATIASLFLSEQYYAPLWLLGALATTLWWDVKPERALRSP